MCFYVVQVDLSWYVYGAKVDVCNKCVAHFMFHRWGYGMVACCYFFYSGHPRQQLGRIADGCKD